MDFILAPEAIAAGYDFVAHDTIGSTNADSVARLRDGATAPFWVVSQHQSEGRGRRGSAWSTPPGNLAASLALTLDAEPAVVATLGFVAGVALARALESAICPPPCGEDRVAPQARTEVGVGQDGTRRSSHAGPDPDPDPGLASRDSTLPVRGRAGARFTLKWPNDLLVDGAKLAGILLETELIKQGRAVVIGIGVNVAHTPEGLPYPATSLRTLGTGVSAEQLFAALSAEWVRAYTAWDRGLGFEVIRRLWLARAAGLGGPVAIRSGGSPMSGIFETIDEAGQLVLSLPTGEARSVSAGDVYFGNAAGVRTEAAA